MIMWLNQEFYWVIISVNRVSFITVLFFYIRNLKKKIFLYIKILRKSSSESLSLNLCVLCVHVLCIRWQSFVSFFYPASRGRSWEMIFMKFFQFFRSIFLNHHVWFSCSLFIFFPFDQEFELCGLWVSFHVIDQVNKIRAFFVFNNCRLWQQHLSVNQVVL